MNVKIIFLMIILGIVLSGCSFVKDINEHNEEHGDMDSHDDHMPMDKKSLSKTKVDRSIQNLKEVQKTEILDLDDGDKINLSIDIVKKKINGKEIRMLGYNGQIPGPLLRVKQDSTVYINVTNNLDTDTTVHWHGLRLDNEYDGVPGVTMETQMPGTSFEYKLDFVDEGIYWYHPHVREDLQQELGLYGNILVNPTEDDYYNNVNKEVPLIIDDLSINKGDVSTFYEEVIDHTLMGRFGNLMLTNGDEDYGLEVDKGEVVRFYITNVANTRVFNFSIPNVKIKLVGADVGSFEKEEHVNSIILAPAQRYTIEAYFEKEGEFKIKNINPSREYTLGTIKVSENEVKDDYSNEFLTLNENKYVKEDIDNFREYFEKEVDMKIDLTVSMNDMNMMMLDEEHDEGLSEMDRAMIEHCQMMPDMAGCEEYVDEGSQNMHNPEPIEWEDDMRSMNELSTDNSVKWILRDAKTGKENMDIELDVKKGDKIKIRIFNDPNSMHPMHHPIHFHGQRFLVLEKDGVKNENLVWKDTVLVPTGSYIDILLDASNPGEWMVHCHIAEHLHSGMMMGFNVGN